MMLASLLTAGGLVMSGCAKAPEGEREIEGVRFESEIATAGDSLQISYRVVNDADIDVYVVDSVPTYANGALQPASADTVYVLGSGGSRAEVSKRVFPVPDDTSFAQMPAVGWVRLAAGEEMERDVRVSLPLEAYRPFDDDSAPDLPDPVDEVIFCVGVLDLRDLYPDGVPAEVTGLAHSDSAAESQQIFCSDPASVD
ncbi:LigA [Nocardioidaceae bacterium Broad-1]|nr:LigA [Nocardioidaceae bacterium Broad-1]